VISIHPAVFCSTCRPSVVPLAARRAKEQNPALELAVRFKATTRLGGLARTVGWAGLRPQRATMPGDAILSSLAAQQRAVAALLADEHRAHERAVAEHELKVAKLMAEAEQLQQAEAAVRSLQVRKKAAAEKAERENAEREKAEREKAERKKAAEREKAERQEAEREEAQLHKAAREKATWILSTPEGREIHDQGRLVWAKQTGYPWWPGVTVVPPNRQTPPRARASAGGGHAWVEAPPNHPRKMIEASRADDEREAAALASQCGGCFDKRDGKWVHIRFFGYSPEYRNDARNVVRAWVRPKDVRTHHGDDHLDLIYRQQTIPKRLSQWVKPWKRALQGLDEAIAMSVDERLSRFGLHEIAAVQGLVPSGTDESNESKEPAQKSRRRCEDLEMHLQVFGSNPAVIGTPPPRSNAAAPVASALPPQGRSSLAAAAAAAAAAPAPAAPTVPPAAAAVRDHFGQPKFTGDCIPWYQTVPKRTYLSCAQPLPESKQYSGSCMRHWTRQQHATQWDADTDTSTVLAPESDLLAQLKQLAHATNQVSTYVAVGNISDRSNPAYRDPAEGEPSQLAFARKAAAAGTVIGLYSGEVMLQSESEERETAAKPEYRGKTIDLSYSHSWGEDALVLDANRCCNELAFINDYRTDVHHFEDESLQTRRPNVEFMFVRLLNEVIPVVAVVTLHAIAERTEFLLDYGHSYWQQKKREDKLYAKPTAWPGVSMSKARCAGSDTGRSVRKRRRTCEAIVNLLEHSEVSDVTAAAYCIDNVRCSEEQKNLISEVIEKTFCTERWGKGHNDIREHLERSDSFAIVLCIREVVCAAAMVDYSDAEAVVRMMSTHPHVRKNGCAWAVHNVVVDACRARSVTKLCVELSKQDSQADEIWRRFGYSQPPGGMLGSRTVPMFKDTKLLAMHVPQQSGTTRAVERLGSTPLLKHLAPLAPRGSATTRHAPDRSCPGVEKDVWAINALVGEEGRHGRPLCVKWSSPRPMLEVRVGLGVLDEDDLGGSGAKNAFSVSFCD
jgi:hypothetical protein